MRILILALITFLISSCGSSGVLTSTSNQNKVVTQNKPSIKLPPKPSETLNKSTIKGIDSNKNNIRDDLEIAIVNQYKNTSISFQKSVLQYYKSLNAYHKVADDYIKVKNDKNKNAEDKKKANTLLINKMHNEILKELVKAYSCLIAIADKEGEKYKSVLLSEEFKNLKKVLNNTEERTKAYNLANHALTDSITEISNKSYKGNIADCVFKVTLEQKQNQAKINNINSEFKAVSDIKMSGGNKGTITKIIYLNEIGKTFEEAKADMGYFYRNIIGKLKNIGINDRVDIELNYINLGEEDGKNYEDAKIKSLAKQFFKSIKNISTSVEKTYFESKVYYNYKDKINHKLCKEEFRCISTFIQEHVKADNLKYLEYIQSKYKVIIVAHGLSNIYARDSLYFLSYYNQGSKLERVNICDYTDSIKLIGIGSPLPEVKECNGKAKQLSENINYTQDSIVNLLNNFKQNCDNYKNKGIIEDCDKFKERIGTNDTINKVGYSDNVSSQDINKYKSIIKKEYPKLKLTDNELEKIVKALLLINKGHSIDAYLDQGNVLDLVTKKIDDSILKLKKYKGEDAYADECVSVTVRDNKGFDVDLYITEPDGNQVNYKKLKGIGELWMNADDYFIIKNKRSETKPRITHFSNTLTSYKHNYHRERYNIKCKDLQVGSYDISFIYDGVDWNTLGVAAYYGDSLINLGNFMSRIYNYGRNSVIDVVLGIKLNNSFNKTFKIKNVSYSKYVSRSVATIEVTKDAKTGKFKYNVLLKKT